MEDFHKLFYDEGKEVISQLEENLLQLESDISNIDIINSIFRNLHTLKGSGAMFGYDNLSSFTHKIESLYDDIRNSKFEVNQQIINFTLKSADLINEYIESNDNSDLNNKAEELLNILDSFSDNITIAPSAETIENTSQQTEEKITIITNKKLFYISFTPNKDIFKDGTKPIYLIDELSDLGVCIIKPRYKDLPNLNEIDPELCYFSWEIILSTEAQKEEINEVFIFVEDDSIIEVDMISELDLFSDTEIRKKISNAFNQNTQDKKGILKLIKIYEKGFNPTEATISEESYIPDNKIFTDTNLKQDIKVENEVIQKNDNIISGSTTNIESVRIPSKKLDELINLVSEFVTNQARLFNYAGKQNDNELLELSEDFQNLARQFRDVAFDMRLIPINSLLVKFKRLIRDLSKQLNKKVNFVSSGTDTELDKNIISAISDPIMHILRNCMDHGIETSEERLLNNKTEVGSITLKSYQSGPSIIISISDDGAGIDEEIVYKKAVERKIVKSGDKLSKEELLSLIMHPGFSTSDQVSNVSGRGVGMDVVKKNVESLRGDIEIKSEKGKGTEIIIKLPLSLSIIDGLLTGVNGSYYLFPLSSVKKIFSIDDNQMKSVYKNLIEVEGKQYPFINLPEEFKSENGYKTNNKSMLLTDFKDHEVGIIVDEVFSEYQAVLKPIDKILRKNDIFSGASILGDGRLAMVMDVNILINNFSN